jgi:hypothetical protein
MKEYLEGKLYVTKTRTYLNPLLKYYGSEFFSALKGVCFVRAGIGDSEFESHSGRKLNNHLYMIFNSSLYDGPENFQAYLEWIRSHPSYETDYPFDDLREGVLHVIVYKIPEIFQNAMEHFKASEYSKMIPVKYIQEYFKDGSRARAVMLKDPEYRDTFEDEINKLSSDQHESTRIKLPEHAELDFKINFQKEKLR